MIKTYQPSPDPMKDIKCQISWSLDVDSSVTASHFPCDDDFSNNGSTMYYSTKARYSRNPFCDLDENYVLPMVIVFWEPELSDDHLWHWRVEQSLKLESKRKVGNAVENIIQPNWKDDDDDDNDKLNVVENDGW